MKKMFGKKLKEPTQDEARDALEASGLPTKYSNSRTSKFSQYSDYASHLNATGGRGTAPPPGANPYALNAGGPSAGGNPYGGPPANGYGGNQPPAQYGSQPQAQQQRPMGRASPAPTYRTTASASPYATAESDYNNRYNGNRLAPQTTTDTFEASKNQLFGDAAQAPPAQNSRYNNNNDNSYAGTPNRAALFGAAVGNGSVAGSKPLQSSAASISPDDELLMTSTELEQRNPQSRYTQGGSYGAGANDSYGANGFNGGAGNDSDRDSEDEDVEAIKTQMRFTKKASVNVAQEALMSAARAEESGRNALGMLGAQGERISNTERSLALAATQNKIAEEKARELKTLNRSMFAVHVGNPFNSKRRLMEQEDRIKNDRRMEQEGREDRRATAYKSQQRVMGGLGGKGLLAHTETAQKYAAQRNHNERSKYTMEGDSEDEDLENQIDHSLDALKSASSRLHGLAETANQEIRDQNARLDQIANEADTLDVGVHLNTNRLMNIR